jgi:hypothetical protein
MRGTDPYLASVYKHELKIVKRTHAIIDRFLAEGIAPVTLLLNKPTLWKGAPGAGEAEVCSQVPTTKLWCAVLPGADDKAVVFCAQRMPRNPRSRITTHTAKD